MNIPDGPHYAIMVIEKKSIHVPGDERSRTHPGHGYPEHTETYTSVTYQSFADTHQGQLEWEEALKGMHRIQAQDQPYNKSQIVAFHVDKTAVVRAEYIVEEVGNQ